MEGAAGGADDRADVRRRLADLAAVERQACVERAEEAFVSADRGNPASMLRPIQLLSQGVGGKELEALACQWETLLPAQQQQAVDVLLMVCAEGTWQARMWRLQLSQLVAVPSQEERCSPAISVEGTEQAPADTAAERIVGELALAVLAPAGPPQLTILGHLERRDKLDLSATCTSLRQASLAWFLEVTVEVVPGETDMASLAAWLERHQACLHLIVDRDSFFQSEFSQELRVEWNDSVAALPPSLVTSLAVRPSFRLPPAVSALTALTRLELESDQGLGDDSEEDNGWPCSRVSSLRPLIRLRQLSLENCDLGSNAEELLSLPALAGLQALELSNCKLQASPRALSALTHLTSLGLSSNRVSASAPLAALQRLQSLDLGVCSLTAVPRQLSALTTVTHLDLCCNEQLVGGWQHLKPLCQLQYLSLRWCGLTAVPQQLSALTALTRLDFSVNRELAGGWQHLMPLSQLQELKLSSCDLTAVPARLSALTALTHLNLAYNSTLTGGWQHLLPLTQLQYLRLSSCGLTAVPKQASVLTALTRLDLSFSTTLAGGWQRLLPLARLQDLSLIWCGLTAVPEQLSALTALTRLDLSTNDKLAGGWQHLLPLTQLRRLNLERVPLPGGVAPPELAELRCDVAVDWDYDHDCEDSGASSPASPDGLSASLGDAL